jgi:Fe-S-cluster containining protein
LKPASLRAQWVERLLRLYARMDAAYEEAAAAYGFVCRGCAESCCRTRFYHHTLIEYVALREGFEGLPVAEQERIGCLAEDWSAAHAAEKGERPLCPLNLEGRCLLYGRRPMICRLHGIPHELALPGQPARRSPGCADFEKRCSEQPYHRFDRSPLYADLARLESEFQQALGVRCRFKHTIAEMLINGGLLP